MSITPILIIAPSALFFKEKVTLREIIGAVAAVGGVFLLFLA
jgi:drug/metabolite transporter (DMT)-like permease